MKTTGSRMSHLFAWLGIASVASVFVGGCGSSGDAEANADGGGDAAAHDGAAGDAASDAPRDASPSDALAPADGPFACGAVTCRATELCIHPCCGGAAPPCAQVLDGGACPAGSHADSSCTQLGGCRADPCTPPAPFCADKITDPACRLGQGRDVSCLCA